MACFSAPADARARTFKLEEYARSDAVGPRGLITAGEVSVAEVEAVARRALDTANNEVNGLAEPAFVPTLDHARDGPLTGVPSLRGVGPRLVGTGERAKR